MRTILSLLILCLASTWANAQIPELLSYQAVIRGSDNNLVVNQTVGMRINIIHKMPNGEVVYSERHENSTNDNGLLSLEIGAGIKLLGDFSDINWADGPYFLQTDCDISGGVNYTITGTSQLLSVPYALYARSSGSSLPGPPGPNGLSLVMHTRVEPPGSNCENGGISLEFGLDSNLNGQLDTSEVIKNLSQYLCNGTNSGSGNGFKHYLGEEFGGGIIFHLWKDGEGIEHGLIVSKKNQSSSKAWSNVSNTLIGATAQSTWNGSSNSASIVNQAGHSNSAAKLCLDLVDEGYDDWYLPSLDELSLMWHNRYHINKALSQAANSVILSMVSNYWSSTEFSGSGAWCFTFQTGIASTELMKNQQAIVRAVRAF